MPPLRGATLPRLGLWRRWSRSVHGSRSPAAYACASRLAFAQSAAWLAPEGEVSDFLLETSASPHAAPAACAARRSRLTRQPRVRSVSAVLGVLGVVNEHASTLEDSACATAPAAAPQPAPTVPWVLCVRVLHQLELLVEMSAQRALGSDGKWAVLAALESAKAALRLAVLTRSGGCILVGDVAPGSTVRTPGWALPGEHGVRERAERTLRALAAFRDGRALSVRRVAPALGCAPAVLRPQAAALLEVRRRRVLLAGESLRVLRPVVYCLAASRYGRRSWRSWLVSLALDLGRFVHVRPAPARTCCALTRATGCSDALLSRVALSADERTELQRRRTLLAYYLLFSPAYEVRP